MKKLSHQNRYNRQSDDGNGAGATPDHESLPQKIRRICQSIPDASVRQTSTTKPTVRICKRVLAIDPSNMVTWDEVLNTKGKSLQSPASSSLVDSNTATPVAVMSATTQEPVQQTSAGILEMPGNATAASHNNKANRNGNGNKDDEDNNRRSSRRQQQRITAAAEEPSPAMPAASAREFTTFERLRLGDQINFLLFDPYRTLKFLITELKSRLRTLVPDDINVHRILVEIQQTMKRIRFPNATESLPPPSPRTKATTESAGAAEAPMAEPVECILPKERCHVIKEDPLINHARKVNSSCQTMGPQLKNVNACQMCEHQVKQGAAGCNQKRMNGNRNAEDVMMMEEDLLTGTHQGSKDHNIEVAKQFSCKFLQDAIENLKIKSDPFSDDTQKIITQLETELSNFQRELQRTSWSSLSQQQQQQPVGIKSTTEHLKVQCKRLLDEEGENAEKEEETFPDFIAKRSSTPSRLGKKLDSFTQAAATTILKESQTNLNSATQMFCHMEKEKLLLVQQFRASEMQSIQGDLNELHVLIKDQLDDIYQSITSESLNLKFHSNSTRGARQKSHHTLHGQRKSFPTGLLSSSSPSLTALTSSVLSSTEVRGEVGTSISPGHYKKSSLPNPNAADDGNANNTKSMMKQKQKSSSSSLSAADARESHNISDVDKANKAFGEKKPKDHHNRHQHHHQHYNQNHLFAHVNCCTPVYKDTPVCSGKKIHFSAVECEGCCPHTGINVKVHSMMTADAARTSTQSDIKSTTKTSLPAMTCHQHCQQCYQHPPTTSTAQEGTQLISSSLPVASVPPGQPPPYIMMQSAVDETALRLDDVPNATVRTITRNSHANGAAAAEHSNSIRTHKNRQSYQAHNSWQCVNLENPTGCQLKKQICGDRYDYRIHSNNNNNTGDNHSNYPQIHDRQKFRANSSINPSGGLCSAKMHEVGADNGAAATAPISDDDAGDRDDGGAGGDGPIYWDVENGSAVLKHFTCHTEQRKHPTKLHKRSARAPFRTDLDELKNFLDEIIQSTPRRH